MLVAGLATFSTKEIESAQSAPDVTGEYLIV